MSHPSADSLSVAAAIDREAQYGTLPVLASERQFGFWDTLFILGGYGIATWCYTQGAFQATLTNTPQLLTTIFAGNIFILAIYLLPLLFAARYGIDMWQWLKAIFGTKGIRIMVVAIIVVNFPWFGVNAMIFGSAMVHLMETMGLHPPPGVDKAMGLLGIAIGAAVALGGPPVIKWVNRFMVPSLVIVGITIVTLAFSTVPLDAVLAYQPDVSETYSDRLEPYVASIEAAFAFGISWCCSTAVFPRLVRKERHGYWATVGAYGVIAPFFVMAGGILAIVTYLTAGSFDMDLARMLTLLASPLVATVALVLIVIANIGTHGTGSYVWSVVIKSAFPKANYRVIVGILAAYAALIVLWGQIIEYFGAMISLAAYVYGPIMAMIFVDYFIVRRCRIDLRSAYELPGNNAYKYSGGYNWIGFVCLVVGVLAAFAVFDAIDYVARLPLFKYTTATLLSFTVSALLYLALYVFSPAARQYMLRDRAAIQPERT